MPDPLTAELTELVAARRRSDAVEHFLRSCGVPDEVIAEMRPSPAWSKMEAIAHTLVYDCLISDATTLALVRSVTAPTLVLDSAGSTDDLTGWAAIVASRVPNANHRSLPGQWHGVPDETLAPVLIDFLGG